MPEDTRTRKYERSVTTGLGTEKGSVDLDLFDPVVMLLGLRGLSSVTLTWEDGTVVNYRIPEGRLDAR